MCLNVFKMIQPTEKESLTGWQQQGASVKICSNTKHQISNCCCCLLDPTTGDLNAPALSDTRQSPDLIPLRHEPDLTSLMLWCLNRIKCLQLLQHLEDGRGAVHIHLATWCICCVRSSQCAAGIKPVTLCFQNVFRR